MVLALIVGVGFAGSMYISYAGLSDSKDLPITEKAAEIKDSAAKTAETKAPEAPSAIKGKVLETMDGGGYTYIKLEQDGKSIWAA